MVDVTPVLGHCGICGRALVGWREAEHNDPAMDCGGDCLACMIDIEHGMGYIPAERATLGIMARTSYGVRLTEEQAKAIDEIAAAEADCPPDAS